MIVSLPDYREKRSCKYCRWDDKGTCKRPGGYDVERAYKQGYCAQQEEKKNENLLHAKIFR